MNRASLVLTAPLVGPFHTRFPRYNAVDLRDALRASGAQALALATLPPGALRGTEWLATDEIALPLSVVPWANRAGVPLHEVASLAGGPGEPGEAEDESEFVEYLGRFEAGQERLRRVHRAQAPVEELLGRPLDLRRVHEELLPAIDAYQRQRAEEFGEGPGTGWLEARSEIVAERVLALPYERVALLAGADELPQITRALEGRVDLEPLRAAKEVSPEARERALLDTAMRGDVDDPAALLGALRELNSSEALYHEANILLENDHPAEALEVLERALRTDFQEPYYLPGFLLARLGQVYDLAGQRDAALRSYRGVLALSYAPLEAAEAATSGLVEPFGAAAATGAGQPTSEGN